MKNEDLQKILAFSHELFKVKNLLRFKDNPLWTGDKSIERWDSVAEHSYRMALLAVTLSPYLKEKVNLERVLRMILVHDIIEIEAIDYNPISTHGGGGGHAFDHSAFEEKYLREMKAARNIFEKLPSELAEDFMSLFEEYINTKAKKELATREGCFAYALDKIEAVVQVTDWKKWKNKSDNNYFKKSMDYMHTWSDYEPALKEFADLVEGEARKLIE